MIEQAVGRALQPLVEREQARAQEESLRMQQVQSFNEATEFLPNLAEPGSVEQRLFDEILAAQPELQKLPSAPVLVGNMIAGILGSGATPHVPTEDRKRAASPPTPGFDLSRRLNDVDSSDGKKQASRNQAAIDELTQKGNRGGLQPDELQTLIGLKMGRANIAE